MASDLAEPLALTLDWPTLTGSLCDMKLFSPSSPVIMTRLTKPLNAIFFSTSAAEAVDTVKRPKAAVLRSIVRKLVIVIFPLSKKWG